MALLNNLIVLWRYCSFLKKSMLDINRVKNQIGIKWDFRDWPRIMFEAVADAMFAWFQHNFQIMWGWYFFSFGISSKKIWDEPVLHKQLISSQWMTKYLSLWPKPDFFYLRLRLRLPNFIAENFHLSLRMRNMVCLSLIECKMLEMAFVMSLQSGFNRNSTK